MHRKSIRVFSIFGSDLYPAQRNYITNYFLSDSENCNAIHFYSLNIENMVERDEVEIFFSFFSKLVVKESN